MVTRHEKRGQLNLPERDIKSPQHWLPTAKKKIQRQQNRLNNYSATEEKRERTWRLAKVLKQRKLQ